MYKFTRLNKGQKAPSQEDIADFVSVIKLCTQYKHILFDDVLCPMDQDRAAFLEAAAGLIEGAERNFWVVKRKRDNEFAGFVYLYNLYGTAPSSVNADKPLSSAYVRPLSSAYAKPLSSAYVGCCFKREFWGEEVLKIGRKFVKHCFTQLPIHKLKCETMRSNPYVANFLRHLGFELEGVLKEDTFVGGKPENLLLWGLTAADFFASVGGSAQGLVRPTSPSNGSACGSTHGLRIKKRTLGVLDYTSRSINNKVIVADFARGRKHD